MISIVSNLKKALATVLAVSMVMGSLPWTEFTVVAAELPEPIYETVSGSSSVEMSENTVMLPKEGLETVFLQDAFNTSTGSEDQYPIQVTDVSVDAGKYTANVSVVVKSSNNSETNYITNINVAYTADADADFYANETEIPLSDLVENFKTKSSSFSIMFIYSTPSEIRFTLGNVDGDEDDRLSPATSYQYRVYTIETNEETGEDKVHFLTVPQTFTTKDADAESTVTIDDVHIVDYGYTKENIDVTISNPDEEEIIDIAVVEKDSVSDETLYSLRHYIGGYDSTVQKKYISTINTDSDVNDLEVRVTVSIGGIEQSYIREAIPIMRRDISEMTASVSTRASGRILSATGEIEPYYTADTDEFQVYLYYRAKGEQSYAESSAYINNSDGTETVRPVDTLVRSQEYEYYATVVDAQGNILANQGSSEAPMSFTTGEVVTYEEDDFEDKNLFQALVSEFGSPLTDEMLDEKSYLYLYDTSEQDAIVSLEDLPKVLPNLEKLIINYHNIVDFSPLLQMDNLQEVSLDYNEIATLPDLSDCKWTNLSLNGNYLTQEDIDGIERPETLNINCSTDRSKALIAADTYYIDFDGKYPLIMQYKGAKDYRDYTFSVKIGEVTKEYSDIEYNQYGHLYVVPDLTEDFGLEKEQTVTAEIGVRDQFSTEPLLQKTIGFKESDCTDWIGGNDEENESIFSGSTKCSVSIYLCGIYTEDQIHDCYAVKDNEKILTASGFKASIEDYSNLLYQEASWGSYIFDVSDILNYNVAEITADLQAEEAPAIGDYDLVVELADGTKHIFAEKLHVTEYPLKVVSVSVDAGIYTAVVTAEVENSKYSGYRDTTANAEFYSDEARMGGVFEDEDESEYDPWASASLCIAYTQNQDTDFYAEKTEVPMSELEDARDEENNILLFQTQEEYYEFESNPAVCTFYLGDTSDSDLMLSPATTYTYRLYVREYDGETGEYIAYFLTAPQTFTTKAAVTESAVTIGDIEVTDYGYTKEDITVTINNPGNEPIVQIGVVKKGSDSDEELYTLDEYYDDYTGRAVEGKYECTLSADEDDIEVRVTVIIGDGEKSYIRKTIPIMRRDKSELKAEVSVSTDGMILSATGKIEPHYSVDSGAFKVYLYYRTKGETSYTSNSSYIYSSGTATITPADDLIEKQDYEYYATVVDSEGKVLASKGSAEAPMSFTTGEMIIYSEDDFTDKNLYKALVSEVGSPLTNAKLDAKSSLYLYEVSNWDPIVSLEDLPKVLPNLKTLTINYQDITDFSPLLQMASLQSVNLQYNDIAELPDLSDCKWTSLYLGGNYLTSADIVGAKVPETLAISCNSSRNNTLTMAETYYIDSDGKYPLIMKYNGAKNYRDYTFTVTIGEVTKEYSDIKVSKYNVDSLYIVSDLAEDFELAEGQKITAKIELNDQFSTAPLIEDTKEFDFVAMDNYAEDSYTTSAYTSSSVRAYLTGSYTQSQIKEFYALKDGVKAMTVSWIRVYDSDQSSQLYEDMFSGDTYTISNVLNYKYSQIYATLSSMTVPAAGNYDLVVELEDDTKYTFASKLHVTDLPVVTNVSAYQEDGYDYTGDYYYIRLQGYYLDATKVWPVIVDENGTEYTSLVDMTQTGVYVYKLRKKDNWSDIEKASSDTIYYVKLQTKGEVLDRSAESDKKIKASRLKTSQEGMDLDPIESYYNWKKQTIELVFNSSVPEGTEVRLTLYDYDDYSRGKQLATASGKVDKNHRLSFIPKTTAGEVYVLEDEGEFDLYLSASDGKDNYTHLEWFRPRWYNYSTYSRLYLSTGYYRTGADVISVTAYAASEKHTTNELYVKLFNAEGKELSKSEIMIYRNLSDSEDRFSVDSWSLGQKLAAGIYTLKLYETVNGAEKELCIGSLYVLENDIFYQDSQYVTYDKQDGTKVLSFSVYLPGMALQNTTDQAELEALVAEKGFQVEVFDSNGAAVNAVATPYRAYSSGSLYYTISGLDKDSIGYYFRFTCQGQTAKDVSTGKDFYDNTALGKWGSRSESFYVSYNSDRTAYTYFYASAFAEDAPYTLNFYEMGDHSVCIKTMTIEASQLDSDGNYRFTKADLADLTEDEVYYCVILSSRGKSTTDTGYFEEYDKTEPDPVMVAVESVSITGNKGALEPGGTMQLQAVVSLSNATNKNVTWSSSDEAVVTVTSKGLVTAVAAGEAKITVTTVDGGKTAICTVSVADNAHPATASISITGGVEAVKPGETVQLQAVIQPENATDKNVTWSSSNESVATVDQNGLVTAVAAGSTVITVTAADGGMTASYTLNVLGTVIEVQSVSIKGGKSLQPGKTMQLQAVITPDNATDKNVVWSSSNESVATVDSNGLVTAVATGSAVITVTTADGGKTAAYTLSVFDVDDSLYVEFADGSEYTFTGTKITPAVDVFYRGEQLIEGVDYTVKYANNVNASDKNATVTVTGKTVAASATASFKIAQKNLSDSDIQESAILITSGSKAVPVLYYGSYKLTTKDFVNADAAKTFTANGSITLKGQGNFYGEKVIEVKVVDKDAIGKIKVSFKANARTYDGKEQYLQPGELTVTDTKNQPLTEGTDYKVIYPLDVTSAGTVKFTVAGIGSYTGAVTKSYKIAPAKKSVSEFKVSAPKTVFYKQGGVTPAVTVSYGSDELTAGRDYKLSYSGNKKIGTGKYTVTLLGNYKGSAKLTGTFEIKAASIAEAVVNVPDKAFIKAGKYISAPYVSIGGVALGKKDYTVKYMIGDRELTAKDKLTEDDLQNGTLNVQVIVTGKGNYDSKTSATGAYRIAKATADYDLSKAKVDIRDKNQKKVTSFAYTGDEIELGDEYTLYVTIGKSKTQLKQGVDFTVSYFNNVNKGKATIILTGLGDESQQNAKYYGSKTTTFKIVKGKMKWF